MTPSLVLAETINDPVRPVAWWWLDVTETRSQPTISRIRVPETISMVWPAPGETETISWSIRSGISSRDRCWITEPPSATASNWMPRQMPRSGTSASAAWRQSAISLSSRAGSMVRRAGWGSSPK